MRADRLPSQIPFALNSATRPQRATAGVDFISQSGALVFNPGETMKTAAICVNGDIYAELNAFVILDLSRPNGVTLPNDCVYWTIRNDDTPSISGADVGIAEGNSGTTLLVDTVTRSMAVE